MKNLFRGILKLFGFSGCNPKGPEVAVNDEDGFADLTLHLEEIKRNKDGSYVLTVRDTFQDTHIGFELEMGTDVREEFISGSAQSLYWGKGFFVHTGPDTAEFIRILSHLYSVESKPNGSCKIPIEFVGLCDDPRLLISQPVKMKFFFNSTSSSDRLYAEVFINADISNNLIEFHEKDIEYRVPLVNSLCGMHD